MRIPVGFFLNSFSALCADAEARNETFLNVLRASIQKSIVSVTTDNNLTEVIN